MNQLHLPRKLILILFLIFIKSSISSQTLVITASQTSGCSPLVIQFTTNMPGLGSGNYQWLLGNGNSSELANPVATYINSGIYTIQLSVNDNGSMYSSSTTIEVFANPQVSFQVISGSTSGCAPLSVQFQSNSSPGSSQIVSWHWNFGNGTSQSFTSSINPTVSYNTHGDFSVTLQVNDANGCSSSHTELNYIQASGGPNQQWFANPSIFCEIPATTLIMNNMTGVSTYSWTTSDGQTSTSPNPSFTFNTLNNGNITLIATDAQGCSSSRTYPITIGDVVAAYQASEVICLGDELDITNVTSIANSFNWTYPGGSSGNAHPTISLSNPGWNVISLTANLNGNCHDTYVDSVFVEIVNANFALSDPYICSLPQNQQYTNYSYTNSLNGGLSYYWLLDFEANTSQSNPSILYTEVSTLFNDGFHIFYDTLIVISPNGCIDTATSQTDIYLPHVWLTVAPIGGCVPFTPIVLPDVNFNVCPYDSIVMHIWDWGDGTIDTALIPPSHTYQDSGTFNLTLYAVSALGCVVDANSIILVGDTTNIADFIVLPPYTICGSDSILISNLSTINTNDFSITWYLNGELAGSGFSPSLIPQDTGWVDVSMFINNNMCIQDTSIENAVYINGPITTISGWFNCEPNPYLYDFFLIKDQGYETFTWDFGDNTFDTVNAPLCSHEYTQSMETYVNFHSVNHTTGCDYRDSILLMIRNPIAVIEVDTLDICAGDTLHFNANQSQDQTNYLLYNVDGTYQWTFGDSAWFQYAPPYDSLQIFFTPDSLINYVYNEPGIYEVSLVVYADNACLDTTRVWINVRKPLPDFNIIASDFCNPVTAQFENITQHDVPILSWNWSFGAGNTSVLQDPPPINYGTPGAYFVTLEVVDSLGCIGSKTEILYSASPEATFTLSTDLLCLSDTLFLTNTSNYISPNPQCSWYSGNNLLATGFEPYIVFPEQGLHELTLIMNDGGCIDTSIQANNEVMVQQASFVIDTSISGKCSPVFVDFTIEPYVNYFISIWWSFGDGGTGHTISPQHVYSIPGDYTVSFEMETSAGCVGTSTLEIPIGGSSVSFNLEPDEICLGDSVIFTLSDSSNLGDFYIDFGDGNGSNTAPVTHTYTIPGLNEMMQVFYTWKDINGECQESDSSIIKIINVRPIFTVGLNNSQLEGCEPHVVQFINESINANEYYWDFGEGGASDLMHPNYVYPHEGIYEVVLTISNSTFGCDNVSSSQFIQVNPKPKFSITPNPELCFGDTLQLSINGEEEYSYTWSPDSFISDVHAQNPMLWPPATYNYQLELVSENDCLVDTPIQVFVQSPASLELNLNDTSIIVGEWIYLDLGNSYQVSYEWTPLIGISNPESSNPSFQPMESTQYFLQVDAYANDILCFTYHDSLFVDVFWEFTLDVPSVFSPNGDGINDELFVRGWGILELIEFSVFNRWGERVYFSQNLKEGWDGYYKGVAQPGDSYYFQVKVKTFDNRILGKEGLCTLIR